GIFRCFGICSCESFRSLSSISALILALLLGGSSFRRRSPYPLLWVDPLRVWVWGVCLCLGSSCLAVCLYSGVSEFVLGKTLLQMPSVYLHSLLSFSLCLMGRSADHQPNARSAQTGEADKLMGCAADHDPTGWGALRTMHHVDPLSYYC